MVHWVQGVAVVPDVRRFVQFVLSFTGGVPVWKQGQGKTRGRRWDNTCSSTCGTTFLWIEQEGGFSRVWLSLPGSACERMSVRDSVRLITGLFCHYQLGFTRIDAKIRISASLLSTETAYHYGRERGDIKGCRKVWRIQSPDRLDRDSQTVYFGSYQSDSQTRIYDPFEKHDVIGATDIEAELCDEKAQEFAGMLASLPKGFEDNDAAQIIAAAAIGQITFINRDVSNRAGRCPTYSWWQAIIDLVGGSIKIFVGRHIKTFEKTIAWHKKAVFASLAAIGLAFGDNYLLQYIKREIANVKDKLSPEWLALVEEAKTNGVDFASLVASADFQ
jgi:hypothetical protein